MLTDLKRRRWRPADGPFAVPSPAKSRKVRKPRQHCSKPASRGGSWTFHQPR